VLAQRGVRAGDRVAMLAPNDDRLVLAVLACWWLGAVACPLNVRWSRVELCDALLDCEPALPLADETLQALMVANATGDSVPTLLQALLREPGFTPQRVKSLNRIAFGAAPMSPALLDRALAAWPQAEFFQAYGLTETAGAVCINLPDNHRSAEARAAGKLNA